MIGSTELIIIGILAIFLFGAKRIPELARNLGRAKGEFQAGVADINSPSSAEIDMDRGGISDDVAKENEYPFSFLSLQSEWCTTIVAHTKIFLFCIG